MKGKQTIQSFEYQWKNLPTGSNLLSDQHWQESVDTYILDELCMSRSEIKGKIVLDAGCGQGRWSYGFLKLGCLVYGFDASQSAVDYANSIRCVTVHRMVFKDPRIKLNVPDERRGYFWKIDILDMNALKKIFKPKKANIIYCWGVLHHTVNPERAFDNLVRLLKPGGIIHLYLYGKKSLINRFWRKVFNAFSFGKRVLIAKAMANLTAATQHLHIQRIVFPVFPFSSSTHSNFDAFSPAIASNHTEEEVKEWFHKRGLTFKRYTPKWVGRRTKDLFVTGSLTDRKDEEVK